MRETRVYITFPKLRLCGNAFLKLTHPLSLRGYGNSNRPVSGNRKLDGQTSIRWISELSKHNENSQSNRSGSRKIFTRWHLSHWDFWDQNTNNFTLKPWISLLTDIVGNPVNLDARIPQPTVYPSPLA